MSASIKSIDVSWNQEAEPWTTPNSQPGEGSAKVAAFSTQETVKNGGTNLGVVLNAGKTQKTSGQNVGSIPPKKLATKTLKVPGISSSDSQIERMEHHLNASVLASDLDKSEPWTRSNVSTDSSLPSQTAHTLVDEDTVEEKNRFASDKTSMQEKASGPGKYSVLLLIVGVSCVAGIFAGHSYRENRDGDTNFHYQENLTALEAEYESKLNTIQQAQENEKAALVARIAENQKKLEAESKKELQLQRERMQAESAEKLALIRSDLVSKISEKEQQLAENQREMQTLLETENKKRLSEVQGYQSRISELTENEAKLKEGISLSEAELVEVRSKLDELKSMEEQHKLLKNQVDQLTMKLNTEKKQAGETGNNEKSANTITETPVSKSPSRRVANVSVAEGNGTGGWNTVRLAKAAPSKETIELFKRMENGKLTYLQRYLVQGGNPEVANTQGEPLLVKAAILGYYIMVKELLRAGAEVDSTDLQGRSALVHASLSNNVGIAGLLISHGASTRHASYQGETPLNVATRRGYSELTTLLNSAHRINTGRNSLVKP